MTLINEIHTPAMDNPLGILKIPAKERINPKIHRIQLDIGSQQKTNATDATIKPNVPTLFF